MKLQLLALLLVVAATYASPVSDVVVVDSPIQRAPRFIVENQIRRVIQEISNRIKDGGYDPLIIENEEFVFHPVPFVIQMKVLVENLRFEGASNIAIHYLDYNHFLDRLLFDISLPELSLSVSNSSVEITGFDNKIEGQFNGSLNIQSIRLSGEVHVNVGIISGVSLRSVSLNFSLGDVQSDLFLVVQGNNHSDLLNAHLNQKIPNAIEQNSIAINAYLEEIFKTIFDLLA